MRIKNLQCVYLFLGLIVNRFWNVRGTVLFLQFECLEDVDLTAIAFISFSTIECISEISEAATRGVLLKKVFLRPATLLKKRLWHRCFPLNFVNCSRIPLLQNTSGRLLLRFITTSMFLTAMERLAQKK